MPVHVRLHMHACMHARIHGCMGPCARPHTSTLAHTCGLVHAHTVTKEEKRRDKRKLERDMKMRVHTTARSSKFTPDKIAVFCFATAHKLGRCVEIGHWRRRCIRGLRVKRRPKSRMPSYSSPRPYDIHYSDPEFTDVLDSSPSCPCVHVN